MASRTLSIPRNILPAMELIAQHHEKLSVLRTLIEGLPPAKRTSLNVARQLARQIGISAADARQVVTQLMSFHQLRETFGMSASEVLDAVLKSLELDAPDDWKTKNIERWKAARPAIEEICSGTHPLYFVQ